MEVDIELPGIDALTEYLRRLQNPDFTLLCERLADAMWEDNLNARMEGVGGSGLDLMEILPSTVARRRRRGDGNGPPLAPNDAGSRTITAFKTHFEQLDTQTWLVIGEWDISWLHFHVTGTKWMVARNIVGLRPQFIDQAEAITRLWASEYLDTGFGFL